jgi:GH24 family phage-related lysozyme (muramidase)
MTETSQEKSLEERRLEFEERKWGDDFSLRKLEAEMKARDGTFASRLFSPVTATVLAGILTVAGSVTATLIQNGTSLSLEKQKSENSERLESEKQQHELILKMISVDNVEQARTNVRFLAETELITNKELAKRLLASKETPLIKPTIVVPQGGTSMSIVTADDVRRLVSDDTIKMMTAAEGGTAELYVNHPRLLGGPGGITIGIGYDLRYVTAQKFKEDWASYLNQSDLEALALAAGKTGDEARSLLEQLAHIEIRLPDALTVFQNTLAQWATTLERSLPNVRDLPPDSYGALLSLIYNRGTPFKNTGDRYTEMRQIQALMEKKEFAAIPQQLRAVKRLWPSSSGLPARRENEAQLFEKGLAELNPPARQ